MAPRKKPSNLAQAYAQQSELEQTIIGLKAKEADRLSKCAHAAGLIISDLTDEQLIEGFRGFVSTTSIAKPGESPPALQTGPTDKTAGKAKAGAQANVS